MPRNENPVSSIEMLSLEDRLKEPGYAQEHCYLLASAFVSGCSVLDVGAGTGSGLPILRAGGAAEAHGIDPLPAGLEVSSLPVTRLRDQSYDVVTCFDVIEHVEDDVGFLKELLRVARCLVFLSTPNWDVWHCKNRFHVREYNPEEFTQLLSDQSYLCWTAGANRVDEPVVPCTTLTVAKASYLVAIRGSACSTERWDDLLARAAVAASSIPGRLSRLGKWSEEWTAELLAVFSREATAVSGLLAVAQWLSSLVSTADTCIALPGSKSVAMDVMRHGVGTAAEQRDVVSWACRKILG